LRGDDPNTTRVLANCKVEFTKSSWLKSAIEKGSLDGSTAHFTALLKDVTAHLTRGVKKPGKPGKRPKSGVAKVEKDVIVLEKVHATPPTPAGFSTLTQLLLLAVVVACAFANLWFWIQIGELQSLQRQVSWNDQPLLSQNPGFVLDSKTQKTVKLKAERLKNLEEEMQKVHRTMEEAEIRLGDLLREIEWERSQMNDAIMEGLKTRWAKQMFDASKITKPNPISESSNNQVENKEEKVDRILEAEEL